MKIDIDYEGKKYNFEIPYDATVKSLKQMSQNILKSDNALLNLMLGSEKIDWNDDNILIRDLIPNGDDDTTFIVKMSEQMKSKKQKLLNDKIKQNNNSKDKLVSTLDFSTEKEKTEKEKIEKEKIEKEKNEKEKNEKTERNDNVNLKKLNSENSGKMKSRTSHLNKSEMTKKSIDKISNHTINSLNIDHDYLNNIEMKIFLANYINKSNTLFVMMKAFNDKIKEVNLNLFQKSKNFDINQGNNIYFCEMSLFQKRIFDFQDQQINYYKKLIQILDNINSAGNKNFDEFYNKLVNINDDKIFLNKENDEKNIYKKRLPDIELFTKKKIIKTTDLKSKNYKKLKLPSISSINSSVENSDNDELFMINEYKNNNTKSSEKYRRNNKTRDSYI